MFAIPCALESFDHTIPVQNWACKLISIYNDTDLGDKTPILADRIEKSQPIDTDVISNLLCEELSLSRCPEALPYIPKVKKLYLHCMDNITLDLDWHLEYIRVICCNNATITAKCDVLDLQSCENISLAGGYTNRLQCDGVSIIQFDIDAKEVFSNDSSTIHSMEVYDYFDAESSYNHYDTYHTFERKLSRD